MNRDPLPGILVVDDEPPALDALARALKEDFCVFTAASASEAMLRLEQEPGIRIILCDQHLPDTSGIEFLAKVRQRWPQALRLILSGAEDAQDIPARSDAAGIWQYLRKPWQPDRLLHILKRAAECWRLEQNAHSESDAPPLRQTSAKADRPRQGFGLDSLLRAPGSPLEEVVRLIRKVAPHDIPVLISGESGTGKEMVAQAIHSESRRANRLFVVENCGALPDSLLEAELFGHKRGAFTGAVEDRIGLFQQADGGTLFLDEIGDTSPAFQVKLLRVLQEGEFRPVGSSRPRRVDVRVIAASNRDLEEEVRAGRFREDLYYRLAAVSLTVPPLRERRNDIPLLAQRLAAAGARALGKPGARLNDAALACLSAWRWPGNVRELQNEILRLIALSEGEELGPELLSPRVLRAAKVNEEAELAFIAGGQDGQGGLKARMERLEARVVRETLIRHGWNISRAAAELELSRVGLRSKIQRYGLDRPGQRLAEEDASSS